MTISNILGGFRVAGIYLTDRNVFAELTEPRKESLTQETGLAFIPLYGPAQCTRRVTSSKCNSPPFSMEEIAKFERRLENGYDRQYNE